MSVQTEERASSAAEIPMFYTLESLRFTRHLLGELEYDIKARARKLTRDAGRDTVTEEDMRQAADQILGPVEGDNPSVDDA